MKRQHGGGQYADIGSWFYPVRCTHCGGLYDAGKVTVTARYSDCSVWKTPCCKRTVDDRPAGFKVRSDIERLTPEQVRTVAEWGPAGLRYGRRDGWHS